MSDPKVMIEYSDDSGRTWSAEQWHSIGVEGDYLNRIVLHAQGSAVNRIYRLTCTEPVGLTMHDAWADVEFGH